jgi:hypothetical protein
VDFSGRRPWATAARRDPRSENVAVGINYQQRIFLRSCTRPVLHASRADRAACTAVGAMAGRRVSRRAGAGAWRRATHAACVQHIYATTPDRNSRQRY